MKIENYLKRFYDVEVGPWTEWSGDVEKVVDGVEKIELYEFGEDSEPIGWLRHQIGKNDFEWRNVYGKLRSGTVLTEPQLRSAARKRAFY